MVFILQMIGGTTPSVPSKTTEPFERTPSVSAFLRVGGVEDKVTLIGRAGSKVIFTPENSTMRRELKLEEIESTYFDGIKVDRYELMRAIERRDWVAAVGILLPPLKPYFAYLDLPGNNVAQEVLNVGDYMMRAAQYNLRAEATEQERQLAKKQYEEAFEVLKQASKAEWCSVGIIARLKCLKCVLELGKPKTARAFFEKITPPAPGDAAYGLYWLLKAELDVNAKDYRAAMEAAVKSLCFENKDIDTFPDALLISARCYEEFLEWHRARDVYYEVARIFPNTDWADLATERLRYIMKNKLTEKEEEVEVQEAFFALKEDMNKLANSYLASYRSTKGVQQADEEAEEQKRKEKELDLKRAKDFGEGDELELDKDKKEKDKKK
jgi:hypothetical protein